MTSSDTTLGAKSRVHRKQCATANEELPTDTEAAAAGSLTVTAVCQRRARQSPRRPCLVQTRRSPCEKHTRQASDDGSSERANLLNETVCNDRLNDSRTAAASSRDQIASTTETPRLQLLEGPSTEKTSRSSWLIAHSSLRRRSLMRSQLHGTDQSPDAETRVQTRVKRTLSSGRRSSTPHRVSRETVGHPSPMQ